MVPLASQRHERMRRKLGWRVDVCLASGLFVLAAGLAFTPWVRELDQLLAKTAQADQIGWIGRCAHVAWFLGDGTWLSRIGIALGLCVIVVHRSITPVALMLGAWLLPSVVIGSLKVTMDRGAPRSGIAGF